MEVPPQPPGGFAGMLHRHIERVRQYYDDYYAQHEGEENVPRPPPPPQEELPPRRMGRILGIVGPGGEGGLDDVHRGLLEALRNMVGQPAAAAEEHSDSSSTADEAM